MRKKIRQRQMALFLAGAVLLVLSAVQYAYIAKTEHVVRARFEGGTVRAAQVDEYYEQHGKAAQGGRKQDGDIPYMTLWNMKDGIAVAAQGDVRQESFSLIEGYGNLEQILPGHRLEGMYPPKSDTEGCAVSDAGAKMLFGSSRVLGKKLHVDGREYIIRGIIEDGRNLLWIQNREAGGFPYVEMEYPDRTSASEAMEWLRQQEFGVPAVILPGGDYSAFNFLFLTLPLWLAALWLYAAVRRRIHDVEKKYVRGILAAAWGIGLAVLILAGVRYSFRFGLDYIPPKWSDFSFYSRKASELAGMHKNLAQMKPLPGDAQLLQHSRYSAYLAWGSLWFTAWAIVSGRQDRR